MANGGDGRADVSSEAASGQDGRLDAPKGTMVAPLAILMLSFQILPLLWNKPFFGDWVNHVWLVQYYSDHLREHGTFPTVIDAQNGFGNPAPMFYGIFLYPAVSALAVFVGANLAVRLSIAVLLMAAFLCLFLALFSLSKRAAFAAALSLLANASAYQMTNAYFRSAYTEFCAAELLIIAFSLLIFGHSGRRHRHTSAIVFSFSCFVLALGAHPITFYVTCIFGLPLLALLLFVVAPDMKRHWRASVASLVPASALVALWIYSVLSYRQVLYISGVNPYSRKLVYFADTIDSFVGKLMPFTIDSRVFFEGIGRTNTPFLTAPLPVFLVTALLVVFVSAARRWTGFTILWGFISFSTMAVLFYLALPLSSRVVPDDIFRGASTIALGDDALHDLALPIQFGYRLSGFSTIVGTISLLTFICGMRARGGRMSGIDRHLRWLEILCVLAVISLGLKTATAYVEYVSFPAFVRSSDPYLDRPSFPDSVELLALSEDGAFDAVTRNTRSFPPYFYGLTDYSMPRLFEPERPTEGQEVRRFDVQRPNADATLSCATGCAVITNVIASAFSRISVDGIPYAKPKISDNYTLAVDLGPGEHTLRVTHVGRSRFFVRSGMWIETVWFYGSALWLAASLGAGFAVRIRSHRGDTRPAAA